MKKPLPCCSFVAKIGVAFDFAKLSFLESFPTFNLSVIINATPTHIIAAIPLKPTPRIMLIHPAADNPFASAH